MDLTVAALCEAAKAFTKRESAHDERYGMVVKKNRRKAEFGDFQTPEELARAACAVLARTGFLPTSVVEPTCGKGEFLLAALKEFSAVKRALGVEINGDYVAAARERIGTSELAERAEILHADFFCTDWKAVLGRLADPILVIGNPPWVTNADLGALGSENLPSKSNFLNHSGIDAITGKSNFDISEWMLQRLLERLDGRSAILAMLCKTAVARKVLSHAWKNRRQLEHCEIHAIDANRFFAAAVDACFLVCHLVPNSRRHRCTVYGALGSEEKKSEWGYRDGLLLADARAYDRCRHLKGQGPYRWRSGIKHDCGKIMELRKDGARFVNGLGEFVELENDHVFPMLKSSELAGGRTTSPTRWMLVPQTNVGEETRMLKFTAPKSWRYLESHAERLDRRASSIYRKRPRFSVFGVGAYSFTPWKVAISGFYKKLKFAKVGSFDGKPIVLDDTSYFVPCQTEEEASCVCSLLNSEAAREFFSAFIFWDAKRPITSEVLHQLDIASLARELGFEEELLQLACANPHVSTARAGASTGREQNQRMLF